MSGEHSALHELCRTAGVDTSWTDALGARHEPPPASLRAVLRAIGVETNGPGDDEPALARLRAARSARLVEPVVLARAGTSARVPLRGLPAGAYAVDAREEGAETGPPLASARGIAERDGAAMAVRLDALPAGRYALRVEARGRAADATLLVSSGRMHDGVPGRAFGLFAPAFTLRRARGTTGGTLTDLACFAAHAAQAGAGAVATLPLLPLPDGEKSPYAPISRCYWNERLLDPRTLPGAAGREVDSIELSERFFDAGGSSEPSYRAWLERTPRARAYARFRAELDVRRGETAGLPALARRHLFLQWSADMQMARIGANAARHGPGLLLDLPVGAHPDGFDRSDAPDLYAAGASIGAPPDPLAEEGQDWGLPLVRPGAARASGHGAFSAAVRHLARHAGLLRVDHVMGLHRLFAVPRGFGARDGTYVRMPADELWAALDIESNAARCAIVGEDLGVVPDEVREQMAARGVLRTWVTLFELGDATAEHGPREPPAACVASLTTHDTPTIAGFLRGRDIEIDERLGRVDADAAATRRTGRAALVARLRETLLPGANGDAVPAGGADADLLRALLARLAASPARLVVASLDDLLLVEEPVNVPGTTTEHPNWTSRDARTIQEAFADERVRALLDALSRG